MNNILVIFSAFAPQNNCASIPNTKLTKYLLRENLKITLVTSAITPDMEIDESLLPKELQNIKCIRVNRSKWYEKTISSLRNRITKSGTKQKMKAVKKPLQAWVVSRIKAVYFWVSDFDWFYNATRQIKKGLSGEHFDIVYSSYPDICAHKLGEYVRKKGIADTWVADFRDPICYELFNKYSYRRNDITQHRIVQKADIVTVVSEGAIEKFIYPDVDKGKIHYIPNGFDPEDFLHERAQINNVENNVLHFFYAGTLYQGRRDFSVLFQALYELIQENYISSDDVIIEYAGRESETFLQMADDHKMKDRCRDLGYITHQRVIELMGTVDCTLVCSHNSEVDRGVVTGKIFELLSAEKVIIAIITGSLPNSELGQIIKECNAGIVYEQANGAGEYKQFKLKLLSLIKQKKLMGQIRSNINRGMRDKYTYQSIAKQLEKLFETK